MVSMVAIPVYIPNTSAQGEGNGYSLQYSCLITSWIEEPGGSVEKNLPDNVQDTGDAGSVPGLRRSPGGRNNNPIQYSYLGNPMDWSLWAKVHGVSQSWIHIVNRRTTWHELRYKLFTSIFFSSSDELFPVISPNKWNVLDHFFLKRIIQAIESWVKLKCY
ncbi:uncharacterized protein LOC129659174 isoform X5 [Bubalus kerabau]|uniref:uncharacterized protein LOC129659174 isoform X5 n=1 Tax=Bubalus carabanensis TaxID=3119969 RepID=UPI00244EDF65|nr:uncharacterized protein LOC129659174 isoform X5 [Bubalus carabanensis]